jgi:hypothetical protein
MFFINSALKFFRTHPGMIEVKVFVNCLLVVLSHSWSRVLSHIWGTEDPPIPVAYAGKLRDKDRHLIKERFAVSVL